MAALIMSAYDAVMVELDDDLRGFATSFGTGGMPFDVANSRVPWTWGMSLVMLVDFSGAADHGRHP